ncbi:MAG: carotenoid 1,2-hydratase [Rhizobacter sp.]|nr:carotenoid 1,2-hydratase [Chlorobiales bacterium]
MKKILMLAVATGIALAATVYIACGSKEEFEYASKSYTLSFPKDEASHDRFRTEWWYYTGHLISNDSSGGGKTFGYELTFFRTALSLKETEQERDSQNKNIYFAHFAITDESGRKFYFNEKQSRGSFGDGGAAQDYHKTFIGNWSSQSLGNYQLIQAETNTDENPLSLALILEPLKPAVLHGERGYSRKGESETNASMYFSYTRLKTTGAISIGGERYTVTGASWFDHEFGTSTLDKSAVGWDWFSLQLSDSTEVMLYALREQSGATGKFSSGTLVRADGSSEHLTKDDFTIEVLERYKSSKTSAEYPCKWKLKVPKLGFEATVVPTVQDQELQTKESTRVSYWEGSAKVEGTKAGKAVSGKGYVELTGYAEAFKQNF